MKTIGERLEEGWNYIDHDGAYDILRHVDDDMYLVAQPTSEYIVSPTDSGILWECQCKDFQERGAKNGEGCKHIQLLDKTLRKQAELQETIDKDFKKTADAGAKKMAADKKKGAKKKDDTEAQEKLDEKRTECDAIYGAMDREIRDGKREELLHDIAKRLIDAKLYKEVYTDQLEKKLKNLYNAGLVTLINKYDEVGWDKFCELYKIEADKRPEMPAKKAEEPKLPPGPELEGATFPKTKELKVHKGKIEEKPKEDEAVVPEVVEKPTELEVADVMEARDIAANSDLVLQYSAPFRNRSTGKTETRAWLGVNAWKLGLIEGYIKQGFSCGIVYTDTDTEKVCTVTLQKGEQEVVCKGVYTKSRLKAFLEPTKEECFETFAFRNAVKKIVSLKDVVIAVNATQQELKTLEEMPTRTAIVGR